jgi:hypothetical protein
MYDEDRIRGAWREKKAPTDPVELPYCEGLEIISASELQQSPMLMKDGAGACTTCLTETNRIQLLLSGM